jgi:8-oxo-dGTP pyrophosphatase MutT (NUDIX family)
MKTLKQVGALCISGTGEGCPRVLLVTSRDTGRWIIPKGWPAKRLKDHLAAAREAMEEAGVTGKIASKPLGTYRYVRHEDGADLDVAVFLLAVRRQKKRWPEAKERKRSWFSVESAARRVAEPELRKLIRKLPEMASARSPAPRKIRRS